MHGVAVFNRARVGSDIKEVKAVGVFDAPVARVHKVLDDGGRYSEFMPYTKVSRILKRDDTTREVWSYERLNPPLIAERDYTVHIRHAERAGRDGTVVVHTFSQANAAGPPPTDGVVRVEILEGRWELEPIEGGKRTRATYFMYTSPSGVPSFVVNLANTTAVPNVFEAVRKALPEKRYDP